MNANVVARVNISNYISTCWEMSFILTGKGKSVFFNRAALVISITPGQTSSSGAVDQYIMDSMVYWCVSISLV